VRFGIWDSRRVDDLTPEEAANVCNDAWSRDSFSEIAWLIVALIFGTLLSSIAFSYYRQLLDPNFQRRAPSQHVGMYVYPSSYNQPYNANFGGGYAPPPGPPPQDAPFVPPYEGTKLPGYAAEGYDTHPGDRKDDPMGDGQGQTSNRH